MAIDDIVARIADDAAREAEALLSAARADAERIVADARERASAQAARKLARARADAEREAATLEAGARLTARDQSLAARRALDVEALERVEAALVALPDAEYAALLAREIVAAARPGDVILLGAADAERLHRELPQALKASASSGPQSGAVPPVDPAPADIERGVLVVGDRTRVEVSARALVASRRGELETAADRGLFGREA